MQTSQASWNWSRFKMSVTSVAAIAPLMMLVGWFIVERAGRKSPA